MPGNSAAISVRVTPLSGRHSAGQRRHDARDPGHVPAYVDQSRSHLNTHLGGVDLAVLRSEIADHRKTAGQQKLRADSRLVIAGVLTFGAEAQAKIAALQPAEQDRLFHKIAGKVARATGHQLLALDVHRDEASVHAHFTLRGYAYDPATGKETAWRKTPSDLKTLQDVAAAEVYHLGIERGHSKERRQAMGDNPATFIHQSVRELHESLPADLEKAREKVKVASQMAERVQARQRQAEAKAKAAEADANAKVGAVETLQKRAVVYETRARAAEENLARARADLKNLEALVVLPKAHEITQALPDDRTFFQKVFQDPPTQRVQVYIPKDVGASVKRAEALRDQARQAQASAETARDQARDRENQLWTYLGDQAKHWAVAEPKGSGEKKHPGQVLLEALQHGFTVDQRYGVALCIMPDRVLIPPQKASAKQKAAALYVACKEKGWPAIEFFGISNEVADHIKAMAREDKLLEKIGFRDPKQQATLEKERRPVRRPGPARDREGPEMEM